MPLYKRAPFIRNSNEEGLKDNQEVFYCELTKEMFSSYDQYFQRIMLVNSMVWTCEMTGRPNLTFGEALECEKNARKSLKTFPEVLKAPLIMVANQIKTTALSQLMDELFGYMKDRYFVGEIVFNVVDKKRRSLLEVLKVEHTNPSNDLPESYTYTLKPQNPKIPTMKKIRLTGDAVRRQTVGIFSRERVRLFLKQFLEMKNGIVLIKEEHYKKMVTDKGIKWSDIFCGTLKKFETSQRYLDLKQKADSGVKSKKKKKSTATAATSNNKSLNKSGGSLNKSATGNSNQKQTSISKYLTKSNDVKTNGVQNGGLANNKISAQELMKKKEEELKRKAEEKQKKMEDDKERHRQEMIVVTDTFRKMSRPAQEDLDMEDQRPMPQYTPVTTLLPTKYFGDFMMILEFLHTFNAHLAINDKFSNGVTMELLERALLFREYSGPLTDIIQVLLSTIFSLHVEEDGECEIKYSDPNYRENRELDEQFKQANRAARFSNKYYGTSITDLPMDMDTITEILRLHLLSSGAKVEDKCGRWRYQFRGGYAMHDDPGFNLRVKYPHILRALRTHSVTQLPLGDIIKILTCLINQIMTYSSFRDVIEERLELMGKAKTTLKNLMTIEARRKRELATKKKDLIETQKKKLEELTQNKELSETDCNAEKEKLKVAHEDELAKLDKQDAKEVEKYQVEIATNRRDYFAYQIYLGSDRAHRNYWMFESVPGIFIEHDTTLSGKCLDSPIKNIPGLAECLPEQRYKFIKQMVIDKFSRDIENKENKIDNLLIKNPPSAAAAGSGTATIASTTTTDVGVGVNTPSSSVPDPRDLWMCTADPKNCPVHTEGPDHVRWSFIYTESDLNALINSLNPLGKRERELRDQLENEKQLILDHIFMCKSRKLTVANYERSKEIETLLKNTMIRKYLHLGNPVEHPLNGDDPNFNLDIRMRESLLELFDKVRTGCLGVIKVKDKIKWREAIVNGDLNEIQGEKLLYGFQRRTVEMATDSDGEAEAVEPETDNFVDPGQFLGNTVDVESEDSSDEAIMLYDSTELQKLIQHFAQILLQIKQSIEEKFLGPPFVPKQTKNMKYNATLSNFTYNYEIALMGTVNFSQLFLHFNILNDSIKWSKSILKAYCRICRRRNEPEKMLLCDNCNGGHHMHCLKPKLKSVPANDWFCPKCDPKKKEEEEEKQQKKTRKRKLFSEDSDEEEEKEEVDDDDDEDDEEGEGDEDETLDETTATNENDDDSEEKETVDDDDDEDDDEESGNETDETVYCKICTFSGETDGMAYCTTCTLVCHFDCSIPPLRKKPRNWTCWRCQKKRNRKANKLAAAGGERKKSRKQKVKSNGRESLKRESARRSSRKYNTGDESDDEPLMGLKRPRSNDDGGNTSETNNAKIRRSRNGDLPLHSVDLYALLDDIAKNDDSWPFNRPVSKMEVPDYYKIIKTPMDFAKIKSRLNLGHYQTDYDIMNDIQQIFVNCDLYNTSESDIYQAGIRLERFVKEKCKEMNLPFRPSDMTSAEGEDTTTMNGSATKKPRTK